MKFKPSVCAVFFLFLIPLIVFIALLPGTVIPNYHGAKFEIAACTISTNYVATEEVPWEDCSCGATCTSQFPCVLIRGDYSLYGTSKSHKGTFHSGYHSEQKGCFTIPDCDKNPEVNRDRVVALAKAFYVTNWREGFSCWGYQDHMYISNQYSAKRAHLALFLPLLFTVLMFCVLLMVSENVRRVACYCFQTCKTCCLCCIDNPNCQGGRAVAMATASVNPNLAPYPRPRVKPSAPQAQDVEQPPPYTSLTPVDNSR